MREIVDLQQEIAACSQWGFTNQESPPAPVYYPLPGPVVLYSLWEFREPVFQWCKPI
jgi:hypothetical protein